MRVEGLDHVVLVVADIERSLAWYCGALGLEPVRADEWRRGEAPFASVRVDATTIIDLLESPASKASLDAGSGGKPAGGVVRNMDHLCLVVQPGDLDEVVSSGSFEVLGGPGTRFGAQGDGTAVYVSDPDGNTVELRSYG